MRGDIYGEAIFGTGHAASISGTPFRKRIGISARVSRRFYRNIDEEFRKVGVCPDMDGSLSGRKVSPETLEEVRSLWYAGGALFLWETIEEWGRKHAEELGLTIDEYHDKVKTEG